MVRGLERFRDHFRGHTSQYTLIGGSACDFLMEQVGLTFRSTKDLDIVLIAEALDSAFARTFWDFIRAGQYEAAQAVDGRRLYYRFVSPRTPGFPDILEIFSIRPEQIPPAQGMILTPIPFDEGVSSLSAILLEEEYYAFIKAGVRAIEGISVVGPEHLIPLKARAWLDLKMRKSAGGKVDSADINKHRNDVFRLYRIADPAPLSAAPPGVRADMLKFLSDVRHEPIDLTRLGIVTSSLDDVLSQLAKIFYAG